MKANKFLLTALASAMLVGCADEEFAGVENNGLAQGMGGKLVDAGIFAVDQNGENAESRAMNPDGGFVWMPETVNADGSYSGNQKVGLCWTGRNNEASEFGAVATVGTNVYTNYEYEHVGWLDEDATAPSILDCTENTLANGAYLVGAVDAPNTFAKHDNTWKTTGRWNGYYASAKTGSYTETNHAESTGVLDLGRGVFATNNASVFEGEYLVYYPYTDEFTKGEVIATLPREYTINSTEDAYVAASKYSFAMGYIDHYTGGNSSSRLAAYNLNGYAVVRLYNYRNGATAPATKNISRVIIYSKSGDLLYSQSLDASKSVAALESSYEAKKNLLSKNVYGSLKSEKTNSIVAKLTDGTNAYSAIVGKTVAPKETTKYADYVYVAIPMLPQTIAENFEIVLVDDQEKTCRISEAPTTFTSNGAVYFDYNLANCTFKNEYMVTDEASLYAAWAKIKANGESDLDIADANVINVLNDIRLERVESSLYDNNNNIYSSLFFDKNITVTTECTVKPVISLASDNRLRIASTYAHATDYPTLKFNVPFVVEGAGCCDNKPAVLTIGGAQNKNYKVDFNEKVTNYGTLAANNDLGTSIKSVNFNGVLENSYDNWAKNRNKMEDAAQVYFLGTGSSTYVATLNNNGKVHSVANTIDLAKLYVSDYSVELHATGPTLSARTIETTIATLNNAPTANISESGVIEIEPYTLVNVNTTLSNAANAIVKINGTSASATDGRLDVKGASTNNGTMDNTGVVNFTQASMDNNGLFIDRQSGQVGGKKVDNGTATGTTTKTYNGVTYKTDLGKAGIYVAQVETTERMGVVLSDVVVEPSTVIVEIIACKDDTEYNLEGFEKTLNDKDVFVNSASAINIKSYKMENTKKVMTSSVFGHCVTVLNGSTLNVTEGTLNTVAEVNVNAGANFNIPAGGADMKAGEKVNVTIGTNLNNAGTTTMNADLLAVTSNMVNSGIFNGNKSYNVGGNVTTTGTFKSAGTPNTIKGNFTQTTGTSTFASQTTTTIEGTFACTGGTFERLGLNGGNAYRATVNVGTLGATTGTTSTAWPTQYK